MEIGLSTCSKKIEQSLFYEYSKNSISHMEISLNYSDYDNIDYKYIKSLSDKYNINLWSFHLPFLPFNELDISVGRLRRKAVNYHKQLIKSASDIGIKNFVIHPSGEPIQERFRLNRMEYAKESLYELAEYAKTFDSRILCENLPRTCLGRDSDEVAELIKVNQNIGVCFDTNHLLDEYYTDFIRKLGNNIKSVHVSDYDYLNERHWLPGEGRINWNIMFEELLKVGYDGPWLYEVGFSCPASIIRPRDLTCEDFSRNATEIFLSKPITVISEHIKGLTYWK